MKKQIKNDLKHVTIGRDYIGGDSTVNYYYTSQVGVDKKKNENNKTIFLSYKHDDKEIADRIDKYLSRFHSIVVKRNDRDIGMWKSVREFMKSIRQQDYVVLIVSDLYLRSENCMFEVTEIMKEPEYESRIFPAVVEHGIYKPLVRIEYIKYWQQKCDELEVAIKGLDLANVTELAADLKRYKSIASLIGEFLSIVADKNNPDIKEVEIQIEKAILRNCTMCQNINNNFSHSNIDKYIGGQVNNFYPPNQNERQILIITHDTNIKPVYYFTGREIELRELRQRIEEKQNFILISGMGGIGKTTICQKLFEEYTHDKEKKDLFHYIGYIEYNGDMDSSLEECLIYKKQDNPEENRKAAWRELSQLALDGKLLLFVDNVNKSMNEDVSLQRLNTIPGTIILTSRRVSFNSEFEPYKIEFLKPEQCREVYKKVLFENREGKILEEEEQDLKYVIEKLAAKHTITIKFLAQLANTKNWTVKKLRKELEQRGFQIEYENEKDELINLQKSYEALYDLSELTKEEQNILEAFSVFPYIPLSAEICNRWLLFDAGVKNESDILKRLYRKGWLEFDMIQKSYTLHPVFAQFIYTKCKPRMEAHFGLIKKCQKALEIPENGSILTCQFYIPFAENIIKKVEMGKGKEEVDFIMVFAYLLNYIGKYKKAEELYEKSLYINKRMLGDEHLATASSYNNLAGVYENQGEYEKAKELYRKSLGIRERVLGEEHPATASSYNNLAGVYESQGEYRKAKELYKKSLSIREKILGEKHLATAISYNNLAGVYKSQGEYEKAKELYEKSLSINEKVLGREHSTTAISYNNLAELYQSQGKYKKAKELYEKSLGINKRMLGDEHSVIASGYNNLAGIYREQGEYEKAKELYEKSLEIREKVLGKEHPITANSYNNLAGIYEKQGEYRKAKELYEKSLRIRERVFGKKHPDTESCYNSLARVYEKQGEYRKAKESYKKGLKFL